MGAILIRVLTWFGSAMGIAILKSLGIGLVTYTVVGTLMTSYLDSVRSSTSSLPVKALMILGLMGFDKFLTTVFSALVAAAALKASGVGLKAK